MGQQTWAINGRRPLQGPVYGRMVICSKELNRLKKGRQLINKISREKSGQSSKDMTNAFVTGQVGK